MYFFLWHIREKQDIDRAIQASLSTMKDVDMKKEKPKADSSSSSEDDFARTEEHFPALGAQAPLENNVSASVQSQATVSTTTTSTSVSTATSDSKPSLADRFAMSNSMSVQHGGLNDFPTLTSRSDSSINSLPAKGRGAKFTSTFKAKNPEEDFPDLPSSNKSSFKPLQTGWTQPEKKINVIDKPATKRPNSKHKIPQSYNVNDFPSLGAPSNKSSNDKWFNSSSKKPSKEIKNSNNNVTHTELTSKEVIDRFSPINVPDSPKSEKNKNKKKKKKDKLTVIKNEDAGNNGSLKGNSSLDDIASLLLKSEMKEDSGVSGKQEPVVKSNQDNKVEPKPEKGKGKKKIDKIEKKMESEKEVLNITELKISEPVYREAQPQLVKFAIADEDFPSLGSKSLKKPPPGFRNEKKSVQSNAPPGFGNPASANNKPPPGFSSQSMSGSLNNGVLEEKEITIGTNMDNYQYYQPEGFQERNQLLISTIRSFCDSDSMQFTDFKTLSGEFRRSDITAGQYYNRCCEILGKENFLDVFQELLALLPDIEKQQELLNVYMQSECMRKPDNVLKISGKSRNAKGAWTKTQSGFLTCQTCRQVLVRKDYNGHMVIHNIDSDFPSLGGEFGSGQSVGTGGSWVKAK
jgi:hypothetical protein